MDGMDLTTMMDVMALDLKMTLGSQISTTEAERCIGRAVDDLSRHLPRERIYEHTWVKAVTDDDFTTPSAADPDYVVDAADISASVDGDTLTIASRWPDVPRPVTITLTDANDSITALTVIVKGIDYAGVNREESFYRYNGKTQTGKVYFKEVNEVEVNEIVGNGAGDTLDVGVATPNTAGVEAWIQLDNPVEYNTESIYSAAGKTGTKYTRDTDYEMDYSNGRVRLKNGGSMAAGTTYYANYDRNAVRVDISSILNDLTRIVRVIYPVGTLPEPEVAWGIWEDMLVIGSQLTGESQKALADKNHIMIMYESKHTPPTYNAPGSYPGYLDQMVIIGAEGYALLIEALEHELQAATDLASMRTELGLTTAVHALMDAALDKIATYLETNNTTDNAVDVLSNVTDDIAGLRTAIVAAQDAANTALDGVDLSDVATYLGNADDELTLAETALTNLVKYLNNNSNADAAGLLAQITTDVASLRTAIVTAQDACNTTLDALDFSGTVTDLGDANTAADKMITYLESNSNEDAKYWLTKITTDIADLRTAIKTAVDAANAYLDEVDTTDLGQASVGAEAYLETGDDLINTLNDGGPDVPTIYAEFARTRTQIGQIRTQAGLGFVQEAQLRMNNLRTYIEQGMGWKDIALAFARETELRLAKSNATVSVESAKIQQAASYLTEAMSRGDNLRTYIEQAAGYSSISRVFGEEASQHIQDALVCVQQADRILNRETVTIQQAGMYIQEAASRTDNLRSHIEESNGWVVIANAFRDEAAIRGQEIQMHLDEASKFRESVESEMLLSDRFRTEGINRLNEYRGLLQNRAEYRKRTVDIPVRQPM